MTEIKELEALGRRTWRALEEAVVCGWLVRAAEGHTRRLNSVNPSGRPTCPTAEAIDATTEWLATRGQSPVFRLQPTSPEGLEDLLVANGLVRREGATIMTATLEVLLPAPGVEIASHRSDDWTDLLLGTEYESRTAAERVLAAQTLPTVFGLIRDENGPVAIGMAVIDGHDVAVFNMRTRDDSRRQGFGARVLDSILNAAAELGAERAFLQVMPSNPAAVGLYTAYGFTPRYDYRYLQEPAD